MLKQIKKIYQVVQFESRIGNFSSVLEEHKLPIIKHQLIIDTLEVGLAKWHVAIRSRKMAHQLVDRLEATAKRHGVHFEGILGSLEIVPLVVQIRRANILSYQGVNGVFKYVDRLCMIGLDGIGFIENRASGDLTKEQKMVWSSRQAQALRSTSVMKFGHQP